MATVTLAKGEAATLAECEAVIERGMETFVEVGNALLTIRESKLYRATHATFDSYCRERWGWSRIRAHQLIDASKVVQEMGETLTMVNKPTTERQARPLVELPKAERADAWKEAVERSNGKPTAKVVQEVVRERQPRPATIVNGTHAPDPPDVAKLRAAGKIPDGVTVEVHEPDEPTDVADIAEELAQEAAKEEDLSDADWLASLPVRPRLSDTARRIFDADALAYRGLRAAFKAFAHHAARRAKGKGIFQARLRSLLKTEHPRAWVVCATPENGGCGGTGWTALGECPKCRGCGYWIH